MTDPLFSHIDERGEARMVDVGSKPIVRRTATARGEIRVAAKTLALIKADQIAKGNVLTIAQIAGIQAAKRTADWIPLCHPLPLDRIDVRLEPVSSEGHAVVRATATVSTAARTGVEMEALTAVSAALLTVYDMCKAVDDAMSVGPIDVVEKRKDPIAADEPNS